MEIIGVLSEKTGLFLIVLTRISGIFVTAPVFGSNNLPASVKTGLAFFLALVLFPLIEHNTTGAVPQDLWAYLAVIIKELMVGVIIGFAAFLVFAAVQMAGGLIDAQIGFAMVSVLDPQSGTQMPIIGIFKYMLAILLFLGTNGHHVILAALNESFQRIPVGGLILQAAFFNQITNMFIAAFIFAFKTAVPILATLFLVDVAFGIMARTVPQMNVFIVGLPAKIIIGILILSLVLPVYAAVVQIGFTEMYTDLYRLLELLH